jgi:hypothetical protein
LSIAATMSIQHPDGARLPENHLAELSIRELIVELAGVEEELVRRSPASGVSAEKQASRSITQREQSIIAELRSRAGNGVEQVGRHSAGRDAPRAT